MSPGTSGATGDKRKGFLALPAFSFLLRKRFWPFSMFCGHLQEVLDAPSETLLESFEFSAQRISAKRLVLMARSRRKRQVVIRAPPLASP